MGKLETRSEQLKKKRPKYGAVLDFYVKVRLLQDASRASIPQDQIKLKRDKLDRSVEEGSALIIKEDFPVALESSMNLFQSIAQAGATSNSRIMQQVEKINQACKAEKLDLKKLISNHWREQSISQVAAELGLDEHILLFLVQSSIRPSIEAGMEKLRDEFGLEKKTQSNCPVCSSQAKLNLLKGEGGVRYSLCTYCGFEWRIHRLSCAVCGNDEKGTLKYFHGEGEEAHRIDLCNKCNHYTKTIDYRILDASDPNLEDLATLHLDFLAIEKGYKGTTSDFWRT